MMQTINKLIEQEVMDSLGSRADVREYIYARIVVAGIAAITGAREAKKSR